MLQSRRQSQAAMHQYMCLREISAPPSKKPQENHALIIPLNVFSAMFCFKKCEKRSWRFKKKWRRKADPKAL